MIYAESIIKISIGLMFANKKKVFNGMCLVLPFSNKLDEKLRYKSAITMLFCFVDMEIIFLNNEFKVVDKVILKKWKLSYIPKKPARYVIESTVGRFKEIKIGDKLSVE